MMDLKLIRKIVYFGVSMQYFFFFTYFFTLLMFRQLQTVFLFGYIFKSAVCIPTDQVLSTVWDRWTAWGNSFLQVLCHLLPGGDFKCAHNLRARNPPHFSEVLRCESFTLSPFMKRLEGTPPSCNASSHDLSFEVLMDIY